MMGCSSSMPASDSLLAHAKVTTSKIATAMDIGLMKIKLMKYPPNQPSMIACSAPRRCSRVTYKCNVKLR